MTSSQSNDDLEALLPPLRSVLLLHSNSFELCHYLRAHLPLLRADESSNADDSQDAEHDVIVALEDTVLCTFQQTAYHITKVWYYKNIAQNSIFQPNLMFI